MGDQPTNKDDESQVHGITASTPGGLAFGMQLPVQTLTRTLCDPWEDDATVADLVTIAQRMEAAGLDFVGVCDHVALPDADNTRHMTTTWYDTVATLSYLAAHTSRIHLASTVFVVPYRHPLMTAKAWSTLDHLSGGRAILGAGIGHVEAEFEALGVPYNHRGKLMDEALGAIGQAFDASHVSHAGDIWSWGEVGIAPAPTHGELRIWVAGGGEPAFRRVGQFGHGFLPFINAHESYPHIVETVHRWAADANRADTHFDIGIMSPWAFIGDAPSDIGPHQLAGPPAAIAQELRKERDLGANTFHMKFRGRSLGEYLDQIDTFGAEVMPLVREA